MRDPLKNPRPTCPECGRSCHPEIAFPYGEAHSLRERMLEGIYCCADHLLDAHKRGYPNDRARRATPS